MGGRGAASGIGKRGTHEYKYGTEYKTLLTSGNIKFIEDTVGNNQTPLETRTQGRTYVLVNKRSGRLKSILHYDGNGKLQTATHLDHVHKDEKTGRFMRPHTHVGYEHEESEGRDVTPAEREEIEKVSRIWQKHRKS